MIRLLPHFLENIFSNYARREWSASSPAFARFGAASFVGYDSAEFRRFPSDNAVGGIQRRLPRQIRRTNSAVDTFLTFVKLAPLDF
jgi:hypothetical protein